MTRWGRFEWYMLAGVLAVEGSWLLLLYVGAEAVVRWAVVP